LTDQALLSEKKQRRFPGDSELPAGAVLEMPILALARKTTVVSRR
jgi:hypothetical protein